MHAPFAAGSVSIRLYPHNELAADAIDASGATLPDPIDFDGIRERFRPEHPLSG